MKRMWKWGVAAIVALAPGMLLAADSGVAPASRLTDDEVAISLPKAADSEGRRVIEDIQTALARGDRQELSMLHRRHTVQKIKDATVRRFWSEVLTTAMWYGAYPDCVQREEMLAMRLSFPGHDSAASRSCVERAKREASGKASDARMISELVKKRCPEAAAEDERNASVRRYVEATAPTSFTTCR